MLSRFLKFILRLFISVVIASLLIAAIVLVGRYVKNTYDVSTTKSETSQKDAPPEQKSDDKLTEIASKGTSGSQSQVDSDTNKDAQDTSDSSESNLGLDKQNTSTKPSKDESADLTADTTANNDQKAVSTTKVPSTGPAETGFVITVVVISLGLFYYRTKLELAKSLLQRI